MSELSLQLPLGKAGEDQTVVSRRGAEAQSQRLCLSLFITGQDTLQINLKRGRTYFQFKAREVPVHSFLVSKQKHYGRMSWRWKVVHLTAARKQEGSETKQRLPRHSPRDPSTCQIGPTS